MKLYLITNFLGAKPDSREDFGLVLADLRPISDPCALFFHSHCLLFLLFTCDSHGTGLLFIQTTRHLTLSEFLGLLLLQHKFYEVDNLTF